MLAHACNSTSTEAGAGGVLGCLVPLLILFGNFQTNEEPWINNNKPKDRHTDERAIVLEYSVTLCEEMSL